MTILFIMLIIATWVLGTYEGNHTAAVFFSLWGVCVWWTSVKERRKSRCVKKICRGHIFREDSPEKGDYKRKTEEVFYERM